MNCSDKFQILLNGVVIESTNYLSLAHAMYRNFSLEQFKYSERVHYKDGLFSELEWIKLQEANLNLELRGELQLVSAITNKVLANTVLPPKSHHIKNFLLEQAKTQGFYGDLVERLTNKDEWHMLYALVKANHVITNKDLSEWLSHNGYFRNKAITPDMLKQFIAHSHGFKDYGIHSMPLSGSTYELEFTANNTTIKVIDRTLAWEYRKRVLK